MIIGIPPLPVFYFPAPISKHLKSNLISKPPNWGVRQSGKRVAFLITILMWPDWRKAISGLVIAIWISSPRPPKLTKDLFKQPILLTYWVTSPLIWRFVLIFQVFKITISAI